MFEAQFFNKYSDEPIEFGTGMYSNNDGRFLYNVIRDLKPKKLLEFSPGHGKTTSCVAQALAKNGIEVDYYLFERDLVKLANAVDYLKKFSNLIKVHSGSEIIENPLLDKIDGLDFLLIDANHDYLLAKWYVEDLLPKLREKGVVHIHDIPYNRNNKGWDDVRFSYYTYRHPDLCSIEVLKSIYSEKFFNKYFDGIDPIERNEEDVVREFIKRNSISFFSTREYAIKNGLENDDKDISHSCWTIYFEHEKHYR